MQLIRYDLACRAVAECKSIDEVQELVGRAEAARAYAKQAKNRTMELDAMEIRVRAERKLGEIIIEIRKEKTFKSGRPRLAELGLDGQLSSGAQRLAVIPVRDFDGALRDWRAKSERRLVVPAPLREVRQPANHIARQRRQRRPIDPSDSLDGFRALDGRLIADCLVGEIARLEALTRRQLAAITSIRENMPVANADHLSTIRSVFGEDSLKQLLVPIWDDQVPQMKDTLVAAGFPTQRGGQRVGAGRKKRPTNDGKSGTAH